MKQRQGFIALTTVLVLSAVFLSVSISMATHAISGSGVNVSFFKGHTAQVTAKSCVEFALLKLQRVENYAGNEGILVGEETCTILPITDYSETEKRIQAESTVDSYFYRVEVIVETTPALQINSYEAKTNF